ncbi:MAG: hypothetical protein N3H30_00960 [Candidatus Micrarchaeota archaeon]|nr:hypothetical protein [Candidatus Micrarchaeota archaeon]
MDYYSYYYAMMASSFGYATIVLLITSAIIALLYMASKIIQNKSLESWISNEVFQCLATALFLFLSVGALALFTDLVRVFLTDFATATGSGELAKYMDIMVYASQVEELPHIALAKAYLYSRLDRLNSIYNCLYLAYVPAVTLASLCEYFPGYGCLGYYFAKPIAEIIASQIQYSYYGFLFIYFQLALIELIKSYFVLAFPAGLAFRAFPFTRSLGAFLIASSVALYFVYPLLFSILLISNMGVLKVNEGEIMMTVAHEAPSDFLNYYIDAMLSHRQLVDENSSSKDWVILSLMASFIQLTLLSLILYPLVAIVGAYSFMHQFAQLMQANVGDLGRGLIRLI